MSTDPPLGRFSTKLRRLVADGPFRVGDRYSFASPYDNQHFDGVVVNVAPIDGGWVEITVEHVGEPAGGD
jgi:hypothetical protein